MEKKHFLFQVFLYTEQMEKDFSSLQANAVNNSWSLV